MSKHPRALAASFALLALTAAIYLVSQVQAGGNKEATDGIQKIAAAIKKGDAAGAKAQAGPLAKKVEDLEDIMNVFKSRKKGGLGVGKAGVAAKDGIELTLIDLAKAAPPANQVTKEGEAWEEMAHVLAAVAEVTIAKAPAANKGKKTVKDWLAFSGEMREGAEKLAAAAKSKDPAAIKAAASKVKNSCDSCHSVFK